MPGAVAAGRPKKNRPHSSHGRGLPTLDAYPRKLDAAGSYSPSLMEHRAEFIAKTPKIAAMPPRPCPRRRQTVRSKPQLAEHLPFHLRRRATTHRAFASPAGRGGWRNLSCQARRAISNIASCEQGPYF